MPNIKFNLVKKKHIRAVPLTKKSCLIPSQKALTRTAKLLVIWSLPSFPDIYILHVHHVFNSVWKLLSHTSKTWPIQFPLHGNMKKHFSLKNPFSLTFYTCNILNSYAFFKTPISVSRPLWRSQPCPIRARCSLRFYSSRCIPLIILIITVYYSLPFHFLPLDLLFF